MASKVKKGFLYYLAWILFIVIGITCILACILIFNPGKDVLGLGLRYVGNNKTYEINQIDYSGSKHFIKNLDINEINFNAGFTDFSVVCDNRYEQVTIVVNNKISGFANTSKVEHIVAAEYDNTNKALNINVSEPDLSIRLSPQSTVTLYCPKNYSFSKYTLNVTTNDGSIKIGDNGYYSFELNALNVTSKSGDINLATNFNLKTGNASIKSETSKIDIYNNIKSNLTINTNSSKIYINNIDGSLDISAKELKTKCGTILGNVYFSSEKGYITIDTLGNLTEKTNGNFTAEIDKTHLANIVINKMAGSLTLPTAKDSDITVNEIYGITTVVTTGGNVNIKKAHSNISVKTQSGSVKVTQAENARTDITTVNGTITANFENIGETNIVSEKANIYVNLKEDLSATITYSTAKNISIGWNTSSPEKSATIKTPQHKDLSFAIVNITTINSGNISIKNEFNPQ